MPCSCSPNREATTTNYQGTNASTVCFISNSTTGIYHRLIVLAWQQSSRPPLSIVRGVQTCIYYRAGQTCASTPSLQEPHQYNYSPHRTSQDKNIEEIINFVFMINVPLWLQHRRVNKHQNKFDKISRKGLLDKGKSMF